ncbi:MAG: hypothetical protein AB2L14_16740 [Candidatus Xenobiia bacterium LiM19]
MKRILLLTSSLFLLCVFMTSFSRAQADETTNYYRFWRGFKKADITSDQLKKQLAGHFIPATVKINAGKGLVSYTVAVPPSDKPAFVPDEFALVAYESEERYRLQAATPEGKKYGLMHWDIFDRNTSKSVVPVKFSETNPKILSANIAYDTVGRNTNWQEGYVTFSIGLRKKGVSPADFLRRMTSHITQSTESYSKYGLQGYLVLATDDYTVAYVKWRSKADADRAFASEEVREKVVNNAREFMDPLQSQEARDFDGTVHDADFINMKF